MKSIKDLDRFDNLEYEGLVDDVNGDYVLLSDVEALIREEIENEQRIMIKTGHNTMTDKENDIYQNGFFLGVETMRAKIKIQLLGED